MLPPSVDDRRGRPSVDVVEPAADDGEAGRVEAGDVRREVHASVEPGFHIVLIGGRDVGEVSGLQRSYVAREQLALDPRGLRWPANRGDGDRATQNCDGDASRREARPG